jgi:hypothetical protein
MKEIPFKMMEFSVNEKYGMNINGLLRIMKRQFNNFLNHHFEKRKKT